MSLKDGLDHKIQRQDYTPVQRWSQRQSSHIQAVANGHKRLKQKALPLLPPFWNTLDIVDNVPLRQGIDFYSWLPMPSYTLNQTPYAINVLSDDLQDHQYLNRDKLLTITNYSTK
jgi:hypothetical protein